MPAPSCSSSIAAISVSPYSLRPAAKTEKAPGSGQPARLSSMSRPPTPTSPASSSAIPISGSSRSRTARPARFLPGICFENGGLEDAASDFEILVRMIFLLALQETAADALGALHQSAFEPGLGEIDHLGPAGTVRIQNIVGHVVLLEETGLVRDIGRFRPEIAGRGRFGIP